MKIEKLNLEEFVNDKFTLTGLFLVNEHWIEGKLIRYFKDGDIELCLYKRDNNCYLPTEKWVLSTVKMYIVLE